MNTKVGLKKIHFKYMYVSLYIKHDFNQMSK